MKNILINLLVLSIFIFAAGAKAASILEAKLTPIPPGGVLKADFTQQRHLTGIPKPIVSKGEVILWGGKGLIWQTNTPFPSVIVITPAGLYQITNHQKTALLKTNPNSNDNAVFEIMGDVLSGRFSQGVKGFQVDALPSQQKHWQIYLVPTIIEVKNFIAQITITGDKQVSQITINRPNGDRDVISLTHHAIFDPAAIQQAMTPQQRAWFND